MYATLVFGLNGKQPVDYGKMKRTHYVEGQSGDANWDYTFDMATPRIQLQLREFCDIVSDADRLAELGFSASDLKIALADSAKELAQQEAKHEEHIAMVKSQFQQEI